MVSINNQLVLDEEYDENYQPTQEEIFEYAQVIGIDPHTEKDLLFIARQGIVAPLPPEWKPCQDPSGEIYYFNFSTGESVWDHPCDEHFRDMVLRERELMKNQKKKKPTEKKTKEKKKEKKNNTLKEDIDAVPPLAPLGTLGTLKPIGGKLGPLVPSFSATKDGNEKLTSNKPTADKKNIKTLGKQQVVEEPSNSKSDNDIDDETELDFGINSALAARLENMDIDNLGFNDGSDESEFDIKQSSGDHMQFQMMKSSEDEDESLGNNFEKEKVILDIPGIEELEGGDFVSEDEDEESEDIEIGKVDTIENLPTFQQDLDVKTNIGLKSNFGMKSNVGLESNVDSSLKKKVEIIKDVVVGPKKIEPIEDKKEVKKTESIDVKTSFKQEQDISYAKLKEEKEIELKKLKEKIEEETLDEEAKLYEKKSNDIFKIRLQIEEEKGEELKKMQSEQERNIRLLREKQETDFKQTKDKIENENKNKFETMKKELGKDFEEKLDMLKNDMELDHKALKETLQREGGTEIEKLKEKQKKEIAVLHANLEEAHRQKMSELRQETEEMNQQDEQLFIDSLDQSKLQINLDKVKRKEEENLKAIKELEENHDEEINELREKHQQDIEKLKKELANEMEHFTNCQKKDAESKKAILKKRHDEELDELKQIFEGEIHVQKSKNEKELDSYKEEMKSMDSDIENLKSRVLKEISPDNDNDNEYSPEDLRSLFSKLQSKIISMLDEKSSLLKEVDELKQMKADLGNQIQSLDSDFKSQKSDFEKEISNLKKQVNDLDEQLKEQSLKVNLKLPEIKLPCSSQQGPSKDRAHSDASGTSVQSEKRKDKEPDNSTTRKQSVDRKTEFLNELFPVSNETRDNPSSESDGRALSDDIKIVDLENVGQGVAVNNNPLSVDELIILGHHGLRHDDDHNEEQDFIRQEYSRKSRSDYKLDLKDLDANMAELDKKLKSYKAFNETLGGTKVGEEKERNYLQSSDEDDMFANDRKYTWRRDVGEMKYKNKKSNAFEDYRAKHAAVLNFREFELQDEEDTLDRAKLILKTKSHVNTYPALLNSNDEEEAISLPESVDSSDIKLRLKCLIERHKRLDDEFELENDLNKHRQQKHESFMNKINQSKQSTHFNQPIERLRPGQQFMDANDGNRETDRNLENNNDRYYLSHYLDNHKENYPYSDDHQKPDKSNSQHKKSASLPRDDTFTAGHLDLPVPKPRTNLIEERLEKKWREYFGDRLQPSYTQKTPMSVWGHASAMEHLQQSRLSEPSPTSTEQRLQSHSEWLKCVRFGRENIGNTKDISSYPSPYKSSVFNEPKWNQSTGYTSRFNGVDSIDSKLRPF